MKKFPIIFGLYLITVLCVSTPTIAAVSYSMTTNLTDTTCVNPVGDGYLDLQSSGVYPNPSLSGNSASWNAFPTAAPINFFGTPYSDGITFTDDGFAFLAGTRGSDSGTPRTLPDDADPNVLLAPLWHDFEIVYDVGNGANRGITLASFNGSDVSIIEYDDVQLAGTTQIVGDFEIIIDRREGHKDIIFGYDNLNQALLNDVFTVGIENEAGDQAFAFINNAIASGNLSNGLLICFDAVTTFTVGGSVSSLIPGNNMTLQNNMGDDLLIADNGNFTFATALPDGSEYAVTVKNQPTNPNQICKVTNGTGTLSGENVSNINVDCSFFTVGGAVNGLKTGNSVTLQNNMGDDLLLSDNGNFTFATALTDGSEYAVTVKNQPINSNQICEVTNGTGTLSGANVSNVNVTCLNKTPWTLFLPAIIKEQ